jgi:gliding motility-associated-like protein
LIRSMKRFIVILTSLLFSKALLAEHITGGEMFYTYTGFANGQHQYHITLKLYRDCFSAGAQLDANAGIAIFNKSTKAIAWQGMVPMEGGPQQLQLGFPGPCITNPPQVCYQVGYYEFDVGLPASINGYTVSYQRCCRINGISNLVNSGNQGATYTCDIPGTSLLASGPVNNSARFIGVDTVIVCGGYPFTYSFAAVDADPTDVLRYSFCDAWIGGSSGNQAASAPYPPTAPPYSAVNYNSPFLADNPLGSSVTINPNTGLISGISPAQGIYVVTVCVQEIRQGIVIATQRKDLQIKAGGCDIAKAQLDPQYITCDGFTMNFSNRSNSPLINSYYWEFGDPASGVDNTSTSATPTHTYTAAGDYTIKLVTNRNQDCSDSTTAIVSVWPGFFPQFNAAGICLTNPVVMTDQTTTVYGTVNSWTWDFGDGSPLSTVQNPSHNYTSIGPKVITLTVTNSKGCVDTAQRTVDIITKPPITLGFRDTLICVPDAVTLQASGTGVFSWTPTINMVNANTATPTVNPTNTTTYTVQLDEQGCINTDTVRVRVVTFVTLNEMRDTTICQTDDVQLQIQSDGLQYQWSPAPQVNNPNIPNPIGISGNTTIYRVLARIGSCTAQRDIGVTAVPYPVANAGTDTTICYNTDAVLHGSHDGLTFAWTPVSSLTNATTLNPIAHPADTTRYILTVYDIEGCPKPGRDTVFVNVLPRIRPFAGNDTMVVVGQPLQLNAEGGVRYEWQPPTGLNNPSIKNPIGRYEAEIDSVRYLVQVFNEAGCVDTDYVKVTVFKTNPYVFVPTGFTPNGDGLNDEVKPIAVGIKTIRYFSIYNRWGQMIFSTTTNGKGWDGRLGGTPQGSNVFVWMVSAIDYLDKPIFLKGTVTLIR